MTYCYQFESFLTFIYLKIIATWTYKPKKEIRFSQKTYSPTGRIYDENGEWTGERYSVEENIELLKNNPDKDLPPIRIFVKEDEMNGWGPKTYKGYTGDPKNLENGKIYTLDHRRLVAYREAGRDTIPIKNYVF